MRQLYLEIIKLKHEIEHIRKELRQTLMSFKVLVDISSLAKNIQEPWNIFLYKKMRDKIVCGPK